MTSFCSHKDANVLGWRDSHIDSGLPAILTPMGKPLPAEIHGMGSAVENEEQPSPRAAANARAAAGTAQTGPNPVCVLIPVCLAWKLPLARCNPSNIILSINLLSVPNVKSVAKETGFVHEHLFGAARKRHANFCLPVLKIK